MHFAKLMCKFIDFIYVVVTIVDYLFNVNVFASVLNDLRLTLLHGDVYAKHGRAMLFRNEI